SFLIFVIFMVFLACDAKLFETEDDPPAPEVSEIFTSLSNSRILAGDSTEFWVEASNPGEGSLHYDWNKSAGEFLSSPDQDTIKWRAPFQGGSETIEVRVSNNDKTVIKNKPIEVVSLNIPVVNIIYPKENAYLVQYETIEMEAEAFHDNGISHVEFFVNDSSLGILDGNTSNTYTLSWLNEAPAGSAEIKVTAVARSAATEGSDRITVNIEGVIPGKK
ncbi:MAG: hypothetical protein KAS58_08390, partial [Calditrichia bacterium]|nr:hypothetical protein [Calditrichia bacterium]